MGVVSQRSLIFTLIFAEMIQFDDNIFQMRWFNHLVVHGVESYIISHCSGNLHQFFFLDKKFRDRSFSTTFALVLAKREQVMTQILQAPSAHDAEEGRGLRRIHLDETLDWFEIIVTSWNLSKVVPLLWTAVRVQNCFYTDTLSWKISHKQIHSVFWRAGPLHIFTGPHLPGEVPKVQQLDILLLSFQMKECWWSYVAKAQ